MVITANHTFQNFCEKTGIHAREVVVLGAFLIFLQVMDGLLTCIGMSRYGLEMEGNPIVRDIMAEFGFAPTLALLKLTCVLAIITLTVRAKNVPWIKGAFGAVSFVYVFAAIIPWSYILFIKPVFI